MSRQRGDRPRGKETGCRAVFWRGYHLVAQVLVGGPPLAVQRAALLPKEGDSAGPAILLLLPRSSDHVQIEVKNGLPSFRHIRNPSRGQCVTCLAITSRAVGYSYELTP